MRHWEKRLRGSTVFNDQIKKLQDKSELYKTVSNLLVLDKCMVPNPNFKPGFSSNEPREIEYQKWRVLTQDMLMQENYLGYLSSVKPVFERIELLFRDIKQKHDFYIHIVEEETEDIIRKASALMEKVRSEAERIGMPELVLKPRPLKPKKGKRRAKSEPSFDEIEEDSDVSADGSESEDDES